jgi:hypothetical protein
MWYLDKWWPPRFDALVLVQASPAGARVVGVLSSSPCVFERPGWFAQFRYFKITENEYGK